MLGKVPKIFSQMVGIDGDFHPMGSQSVKNWLVVSTHLKNMLVKMGNFPNFRGENKKCLKPSPRKSPKKQIWAKITIIPKPECFGALEGDGIPLLNHHQFGVTFPRRGKICQSTKSTSINHTWSSRESPWRWTRTSSPHPVVGPFRQGK